MNVENIVCFANSRKLGGRCIAGKRLGDFSSSSWLRPISANPTGELSISYSNYVTGNLPAPLDVLALEIIEPRFHQHQNENWLVQTTRPVSKVGQIDYPEAIKYVDKDQELWGMGSSSSNFFNNRVPSSEIDRHANSLKLLELQSLVVTNYISATGKLQLRGSFELAGEEFALAITDLFLETQYLNRPLDRDLYLNKCLVTVSLGEEFKGFYYKLIAGVILPGGE